jgi:hypothetical protein
VSDFLPVLKQPDFDRQRSKANSVLDEAPANWVVFKKSSQVQNLASNAELNAACT